MSVICDSVLATSQGSTFQYPQRVTVTTDMSLQGWGAHLGSAVAQGQWSLEELANDKNWLELRAIRFALIRFQPLLDGQHVHVLTDNVTAKAHVNCEGRTRSRELMKEATRLLTWAEAHTLFLMADHISGSDNCQADWISRQQLHPAE